MMKKNIFLSLFLLSFFLGFSQTISTTVDCAVGPESVTYCYSNNDTTVYEFTSSDGSPLNITFNAGEVESGWDPLVVYDTDGTTDLNAATPYGNGGDVTGITYASSGDTISFTVQADGIFDCGSEGYTSLDVTVSCATCINPTANYSVVSNCTVGPEFFVDTQITSLGSATTLTVQDNFGNSNTNVTALGTIQLGPYANGTNVIINVLNNDDANCSIFSTGQSQEICLDYSVDCSAASLDFNYCYQPNDTNVFVFTTTTGFPVNITFNQGEVEEDWDEFIVYDTNGTELTPVNYYGNGGDLSGLTYTSTGDSLSFTVQSDGVFGCSDSGFTPINATIKCQTCLAPTITYTPTGDCAANPDAPEFTIDVELIDAGSVSGIQIVDDQGNPGQFANALGVYSFGPYAAGTDVIFTTSTDDVNCDFVSEAYTVLCPAPPNECSMIYAGPDQTFDCDNNSIDLTASFQVTGQDFNEYEINALSSCPTPPTTGGDPTSLTTDDRWSDPVSLGFDFCFFGGVYSDVVIGSNGLVSFDIGLAGTGTGFGFTQPLPNNTNATLSEGNIFAAMHDVDPSVCGDVNYSVLGTSPSRQFVINFTEVCHFSCNDLKSTMQVILYESSNNIDINIFEKPTCTSWNSGNAVIGIQNPAADIAFTPMNRNTGAWTVDPAAPEFYRFSPGQSATPDYVFEWYDNGIFIGNTETITVNPTATTAYTASISYSQCTGGTVTVTDEVTVEFVGVLDDSSFTVTPNCSGATVTIDGDTGGIFAFNPLPIDGAVIDSATGEVTNATPGETYSIEYSINPTDICGSTMVNVFTVLNQIVLNQQNIDFDVCTSEPNGLSIVDLTQFNTEFEIGVSNPIITFHNSQMDADNNLNEIINVLAYQANLDEVLYVRVESLDSGCFAVGTVQIQPGTDCIFPQGISPNNDGLNDRFDLTSYEVKSLEIFNRNGAQVYIKSDGYTNQWYGQSKNGDDLPVGTYYFVINYGDNQVKASWVYINR